MSYCSICSDTLDAPFIPLVFWPECLAGSRSHTCYAKHFPLISEYTNLSAAFLPKAADKLLCEPPSSTDGCYLRCKTFYCWFWALVVRKCWYSFYCGVMGPRGSWLYGQRIGGTCLYLPVRSDPWRWRKPGSSNVNAAHLQTTLWTEDALVSLIRCYLGLWWKNAGGRREK